MATQPATLTYADLVRLREQGNDRLRYELIDGRLFVSPAPRTKHQWVVSRLSWILMSHIVPARLGVLLVAPLDVILDERNTVQPDLVFLGPGGPARMVDRGIEGPPTLVVEVLSPSTAEYDRTHKRTLYEQAGVLHLWFLDPSTRALEAYELRDGRYELAATATGDAEFRPALFPGLVIRLGDLWPPPGAIADE